MREKEAQFRATMEAAQVGIFVLQEGVFRYVNAFLVNLIGYAEDELVNRLGPQDLIIPEQRAIVLDQMQRRAAGEQGKASETLGLRGLTIRLENDLFAGTDRNYTNGVALMAVSRDLSDAPRAECLPAPVRMYAQLIKFVNPGYWSGSGDVAISQNIVVKFGQSMYTPEDPLRTDLIVNDRPYAGLLYGGVAWNRRSHAALGDTEMLRDILHGDPGFNGHVRLLMGIVRMRSYRAENIWVFFRDAEQLVELADP